MAFGQKSLIVGGDTSEDKIAQKWVGLSQEGSLRYEVVLLECDWVEVLDSFLAIAPCLAILNSSLE